MNYIFKIFLVLLLVAIFSSCAKEINTSNPVVSIYSPVLDESFLLPNVIDVEFRVEHTSPLEYVRLSIDNEDIVSVSEQYYFYPDGNTYSGIVEVPIGIIPDDIISSNYFVHIAVSDFNEVNHTYLEVGMVNTKSEYKGCFIISKFEVNMLNITYYNSKLEPEYTFDINGNYSDSDISEKSNRLIIATNTPDFTKSYNCDDGKLEWKQDPQLPYPEFNKVVVNNSIVYLSTEIGRIMGITSDEGSQIYNTTLLRDTIPVNICVTNDYILADFRLRNSNSKIWASFYKSTGSKYHVLTTDFNTVELFGITNENKMVAFCNNNNSGVIITFDVANNIIESSNYIENKEIHHSSKLDDNNYLFTSNSTIYHFNLQDNLVTALTETVDDIIDIKYNYINNQVIISTINKVEVFSYPEFSLISTIDIPYTVKAVELLYGY